VYAQLASYTAEFPDFEVLGAEVLALSPQNVESHEAFQADHKFRFSASCTTRTSKSGGAYGVVGPLGFYRRFRFFIVDEAGTVRFARRSMPGLSYVKAGEIVSAFETTLNRTFPPLRVVCIMMPTLLTIKIVIGSYVRRRPMRSKMRFIAPVVLSVTSALRWPGY